MNDPEYIDPKELQPGPIRHKSLPSEMLEQIEAVYGVIGPYIDTTLEQFEIGFMRDVNPGIEVAIWCNITTAWLDYHEKYLNDEPLPDKQEQELIAALIVISAGVEDVESLDVPEEVGRRLLECYNELGKE